MTITPTIFQARSMLYVSCMLVDLENTYRLYYGLGRSERKGVGKVEGREEAVRGRQWEDKIQERWDGVGERGKREKGKVWTIYTKWIEELKSEHKPLRSR